MKAKLLFPLQLIVVFSVINFVNCETLLSDPALKDVHTFLKGQLEPTQEPAHLTSAGPNFFQKSSTFVAEPVVLEAQESRQIPSVQPVASPPVYSSYPENMPPKNPDKISITILKEYSVPHGQEKKPEIKTNNAQVFEQTRAIDVTDLTVNNAASLTQRDVYATAASNNQQYQQQASSNGNTFSNHYFGANLKAAVTESPWVPMAQQGALLRGQYSANADSLKENPWASQIAAVQRPQQQQAAATNSYNNVQNSYSNTQNSYSSTQNQNTYTNNQNSYNNVQNNKQRVQAVNPTPAETQVNNLVLDGPAFTKLQNEDVPKVVIHAKNVIINGDLTDKLKTSVSVPGPIESSSNVESATQAPLDDQLTPFLRQRLKEAIAARENPKSNKQEGQQQASSLPTPGTNAFKQQPNYFVLAKSQKNQQIPEGNFPGQASSYTPNKNPIMASRVPGGGYFDTETFPSVQNAMKVVVTGVDKNMAQQDKPKKFIMRIPVPKFTRVKSKRPSSDYGSSVGYGSPLGTIQVGVDSESANSDNTNYYGDGNRPAYSPSGSLRDVTVNLGGYRPDTPTHLLHDQHQRKPTLLYEQGSLANSFYPETTGTGNPFVAVGAPIRVEDLNFPTAPNSQAQFTKKPVRPGKFFGFDVDMNTPISKLGKDLVYSVMGIVKNRAPMLQQLSQSIPKALQNMNTFLPRIPPVHFEVVHA